MLITIRRPFWLLGALSLIAFLGWVLRRGGLKSDLKHQRAFDFPHGEQHGRSAAPYTHHQVFSASTTDREYFLIDLGGHPSMNPNIIPHPIFEDTWIVVAQLIQDSYRSDELVCNAVFQNDTLKCITSPAILPIATTYGDKCGDDLAFLNLNEGPHDARIFYGPTVPYTIFGSNSRFTCFGQWIQDFRVLIEWDHQDSSQEDFIQAEELQRPTPYGNMEKNWFLFWDKNDEVYVHHDIYPQRMFAKLQSDGSVIGDDKSNAQIRDDACMKRLMPRIGPKLESIHQASNSLRLTMCKRSDRFCIPDDSNTFILMIFQHKTYFNYHSVYEPYAMLFSQATPFAIHAISTKPIWIHGRSREWGNTSSALDSSGVDSFSQGNEMFYVTSMSWKSRHQKYHGFLDDIVFLSFGIEDKMSAGIDVVVGDLLINLGTC